MNIIFYISATLLCYATLVIDCREDHYFASDSNMGLIIITWITSMLLFYLNWVLLLLFLGIILLMFVIAIIIRFHANYKR